jgi:hypothetical protein
MIGIASPRRAFYYMLALPALASAAPDRPSLADEAMAGVVTDYRPAGKPFQVRRPGGSSPFPAVIGAMVQAGDLISVPPGGVIELLLSDDASHPLSGPGEFVVPITHPLGPVGKFFRGLAAAFHETDSSTSVDAVTRGGDCGATDAPAPLQVPILRRGARMKAGTRDLPLAWTGGCAPFSLTLVRGGAQLPLGYKAGIEARHARFDGLDLRPGQYKLILADGRNQRLSVTIIAAEEGPAMPGELRADETRLGIIARALWLSDVSGGVWRIDSFELLRPLIREHNRLAGMLGDILLYEGPDHVLAAP